MLSELPQHQQDRQIKVYRLPIVLGRRVADAVDLVQLEIVPATVFTATTFASPVMGQM